MLIAFFALSMNMTRRGSAPKNESPKNESPSTFRAFREIIEALAVAVVLAFLFKAFVIELYSIPTGSMASTLMGRHKDVYCEMCGFPFQLGASGESNDGSEHPRPKNELPSVIGGTCPQCQYTMYVGSGNLEQQTHLSFGGDRIFANKNLFSYRDPSRWHVTIFRYPAKPQMNYIKRLVGLANETVMIRNGQIFAQKDGSDHFEIQRKPLYALLSMMRIVDDNDYVMPTIHELGWKTRWYSEDKNWQRSADYKSFTGKGNQDEMSWLKFRYITATTKDWYSLVQGQLPVTNPAGIPQLITDTVAYNTEILDDERNNVYKIKKPQGNEVLLCSKDVQGIGLNWVGDLAVQGTIQSDQSKGTVSFRLVKGGIRFQCDFDLAEQKATFLIPDVPEFEPFSIDVPILAGKSHDVMFCHMDEEMRLMIDGKEIDTQGRGRYDDLCSEEGLLSRNRRPTEWDLEEPVSIGISGTLVKLEHLKVWRNLYYISSDETSRHSLCDLIVSPFQYDYYHEEGIKHILSSPEYWQDFGKTRQTVFRLGKDQFLMCGDNSAQSKDSRLWTVDGIPHYVERKYLIGEAISVFWPHGLRIPGTRLALIPNFSKMRWID